MTVSGLIERELAGASLPVRNGVFVAVVGPSGAGKDTLIAYARRILEKDGSVGFVRRVITRPCDGSTEDHDSLDEKDFAAAADAGAFAVSWAAHGLRYGLPASVDRSIADGHVAVANVSRSAIAQIRSRYANVMVVEVTASPDVLAARLSSRGRESGEEVVARLARSADPGLPPPGALRIENDGAPEEAGEKLVAALRKAIAVSDVAGTI